MTSGAQCPWQALRLHGRSLGGAGGLQISTPQGWISAPPLAGTFVANIGDMLDLSIPADRRLVPVHPHRVRNASACLGTGISNLGPGRGNRFRDIRRTAAAQLMQATS